MNCPNCDYTLWNLLARQCPECGEAFAPDQFEFVPNSVRFCCPHCDQAYYGTDHSGHLFPQNFTCVKCQTSITMNEMVLRPAQGVLDKQTQRTELPWLRRQNEGFFKCWLRTIWLSMVMPADIANAGPRIGASTSAWWFLIFTITLSFLIGWSLPWGIIVMARGGTITPAAAAIDVLQPTVLALVVGIVGVALWGACTHGVLYVTGGTKHTIGMTYAMLCYSGGALVLYALPIIGPFCFTFGLPIPLVWWVICAVVMIVTGHGIHVGRGMLAVIIFPVLVFLGAIAVTVWFVFLGVTITNAFLGAGTGMNWASGQQEIQRVSTQLRAHRDVEGAWPEHGIQLLSRAGWDASLFIGRASGTTNDDLPISPDTLLAMPPQQREQAMQACVDTLPADVVAHRVGDFVFTYHGIDLSSPTDSDLWIVVMIEDPDAGSNTQPSEQQPSSDDGVMPGDPADGQQIEQPNVLSNVVQLDPVYAMTLSGRLRTIDRAGLNAATTAQNALRQQHGLAPLPDLQTVRHLLPRKVPQPDSDDDDDSLDGRANDAPPSVSGAP